MPSSSKLFLLASFVAGAAGASFVAHHNTLRRRRRRSLSSELDADNHSLSLEEEEQQCIYLDYNGTTPIYKAVLQAMMPFLTTHFGNPSSGHWYGKEPRQAVDHARRQILNMLGCDTKTSLDACIFTACGTESDNLAIHWALQSQKAKLLQKEKKIPNIVTCNVEHPAIAAYLERMEKEGKCRVTYVPVQPNGCVLAEDIIKAIRLEETVLVTLMLANNESGALQPVKDVAEHCSKNHILCHTDAAQAVGKVSMNLSDLGHPDMITIVGHKIGAPKGVACLYVRPGCLEKNQYMHGLLLGGGQEFGWRGGTENVPYIAGLGKACELCQTNWKQNSQHMEKMRNLLLSQLEKKLGKDLLRVNGPVDASMRLPNTLSVGIKGVHSGQLLAAISDQVAASAGATCHSTTSISSVLQAMKVPEEYARGTVRLSVGPSTTDDEMKKAASILAKTAKQQLLQA